MDKKALFKDIKNRIKASGSHLKRAVKKRKFKKVLKFSLLSLLVLFVGMIAIFSIDLPTPNKLKQWRPDLSTQILDRNGKLLYEVHGDQRRQWIEGKDMPELMKKATVAAEDKEYYQHFGVNFKGLARAAYRDVFGGGYYEGGSGLTQQFVKNALLSPKRTITRKAKEAILSIELEILYSKDQILEMYLNTIPYGSGSYGVESASRTFFNKPAKDLTIAEAATLVTMAKAPTYYSPYGTHVKNLLQYKNFVIDQMVTTKAITEEQAADAKKQELAFEPYHESINAPHFVMWVKEILANKYGEKTVETGGLKVTTSIDLDLQDAAEQAVSEGAANNNAAFGGENASLVSIDPKTGQVLAMVGSANYFDQDIQGQVNVALSERQPGSSFKPIVYATLLKDNWSPNSTIFDVETDFGGGYKPKNYSETTNGPITLKDALGNSLNIPAVKVLALAGMNNVIKTAKDLGINTLTDPDRYGLSLVLGGAEVRLLELTGAYSAFAQSGKFAKPMAILKVVDDKGKVLEENKPELKQKLAPEIAYEVWDMLSDPWARSITFGNIGTMGLPDRKVGIKTGTTSDWKDAWTIGFTTNLVTGIWAGNADNRPMNGASSAIAATPIWHDYMMRVKDKFPIEDYPRPEGIKDSSIAWISNKKPTDSSPKVFSGIFASWQLPKEFDDMFIKKTVCKSDGLLAPEGYPAELTEEKTFANIHSEMPDNPNWEGPVRGWAAANGYNNYPPTDYCGAYVNPKISINSPNNNSTVSGEITISTTVTSSAGVKYVTLYLDGSPLKNISKPPFSISINTNTYANGKHTIRALVVDANNITAETSINVTFNNNKTPDVTNLIINKSGNDAQLNWSNPSGISFIRIYRSILEGDKGELIKNNLNAANYTGAGLSSNTYYYTVATVNNDGQESNGATKSIDI
ncbi:MAG: transglycosylase domain-containing protein [Patescibacteria group bacterium]|nr:transglycosylase domain-containing protein [Patescibacteria group bacterium]